MNEVRKNWLTILLSSTIGIIGSIIVMAMTFKHETSNNIQSKIESKIDKVEAISYIDKNDNAIRYELQVHKEDDSKRLESMDKKLDLIIQQLIK